MIPLFPLPNVVLFPDVFLPLHIFEERYRMMVQDALSENRTIGVVLIRKTDSHLSNIPAVYDVGCSGFIANCERMTNGYFNIVLRGQKRFRILKEDHSKPYRRATVEYLAEPLSSVEVLKQKRERLEQLLTTRLTTTESVTWMASQMADTDFINALSQYLELEPAEKQALLERDGLKERCQSLIDLLEINNLTDRNGSSQPIVQ
tara:strand:+ start:230 stop:841 length:612 start_codon:yes stop_codon:yes gene_type:complete